MFQTRRVVLLTGLVLVLLAGLAVPAQEAQAAWAKGDASYFQEDRVCRDGMIISSYTTDTSDPEQGKRTILSVRYYDTTTFAPLLPNDADNQRPELYGPLLVPQRTILLGYHPNDPLPIDEDGDGQIDYQATVYTRNILVTWPRLLDEGSRIVIRGGTLATYTAPVTNCVLNRMTTIRGGNTIIEKRWLMQADATIPSPDLVYRVDSLPTHGQIFLNGTPLMVGSFFTQADINSNRLSYTHNRDSATTDAFRYSVQGTFRASVATGGGQASGGLSRQAVISGDGNVIAFTSRATNLVPNDTNGADDVFRHDLLTRQTERLSVSQAGVQGNSSSTTPSISLDGQAVAFQSAASNLVNSEPDAFGTTYCGKLRDTNGLLDVYVNYRNNPNHPQTIYRASLATRNFGNQCFQTTNGVSLNPAITADGEFIAFESDDTTLIENDTNGMRDVFGITGLDTQRLSVAGQGGDDIQVTGRSSFMSIGMPTELPNRRPASNVFVSSATDLVPGDTNGVTDIFARDFFFSSEPVRVSVATNGAQALGGASSWPTTSAGGRFIAFQSEATNLVNGDTNHVADIFVRDRDTDNDGNLDEPNAVATTRVSVGPGGVQGNGASGGAAISADGRYVAFESAATNLVSGDTNNIPDIFVHDRTTGQTTRVSVSGRGGQASGRAAAVVAWQSRRTAARLRSSRAPRT